MKPVPHSRALDAMRIALLPLLLTLLSATAASACPFCPGAQTTLSERIASSDALVLAQWVSAQRKSETNPALTTFQVVHTAKNPGDALQRNDLIRLAGYQAGNRGDLFLLLGKRDTAIAWEDPLEITETAYQYILQAPPPETRAQDRLVYFLKFLEYPDELIAGDAYFELANSDYKDIVPLADKLPRERLRKWLAKPDFTNPRLGLYGMLLGLCGTQEDAELLARHVTAPTKEFRLGIDGMIGGYLLLTGEEGLDVIDARKLRDAEAPTTEMFSTLQALRFIWTYGEGKIGRERLRESMRILLDRPDLADIAIADLARWKDWSVQQKLMQLYDHKDYQSQHVGRAIISYMIAASRDVPKDAAKPPKHVVNAREHLATLRKKDPEAVRRAERFFLP